MCLRGITQGATLAIVERYASETMARPNKSRLRGSAAQGVQPVAPHLLRELEGRALQAGVTPHQYRWLEQLHRRGQISCLGPCVCVSGACMHACLCASPSGGQVKLGDATKPRTWEMPTRCTVYSFNHASMHPIGCLLPWDLHPACCSNSYEHRSCAGCACTHRCGAACWPACPPTTHTHSAARCRLLLHSPLWQKGSFQPSRVEESPRSRVTRPLESTSQMRRRASNTVCVTWMMKIERSTYDGSIDGNDYDDDYDDGDTPETLRKDEGGMKRCMRCAAAATGRCWW